MSIASLFAAVVTPIHHDGRLDVATFDRLVQWLIGAGVDGLCLGGATSEYPHFETDERTALIRRAASLLPHDKALMVGVGASSMRRVIELGEAAMDAGSRALLLSMPMFFNYAQPDLHAFCAHVSRMLRAPCLLYDLPDFTNGLAPETTIALMRDEAFIIGIKDSSGREANLARFADARQTEAWTLLVGDDRLLHKGLQLGWNGGISGVAGFCPELLVALVRSVNEGRASDAARLNALLDELIARMSLFPTPWAIRIGLAARGIDTGPLPLPLTTDRQRQVAQFRDWFPAWLERNLR